MTWRNWLEALLIVGTVIGLISLLKRFGPWREAPHSEEKWFDALRSFAGASPERSPSALGEGAPLRVDLSMPSRLWFVMYVAHQDTDKGPHFSMECKVLEADVETEARALAYDMMYAHLPRGQFYGHDLHMVNIPTRSLLLGLPDEIRDKLPLLLDTRR
jgi:hypothetical protein